ncbi:hypothetical protein FC92_GL001159 [Liquorilactobacillus hordei DSM 19519]|uniref:Uncharacterized protein n=1 Tax=Liquorilactobacillus hordei DSM 19519 TaxID=1423759 RepID=A0A0R1MDF0_9LACO|nr:hypothetical protein FC92_GL001159 [Liquorilactobacillus hordei DSM 19519]
MKVKVHVASAFSKDNKGGNKAGIVLFEQSLTTTQKKSIAKQLGYAETVFISNQKELIINLSILHQKMKLLYVVTLQLVRLLH